MKEKTPPPVDLPLLRNCTLRYAVLISSTARVGNAFDHLMSFACPLPSASARISYAKNLAVLSLSFR